jgi:hypothetical protein
MLISYTLYYFEEVLLHFFDTGNIETGIPAFFNQIVVGSVVGWQFCVFAISAYFDASKSSTYHAKPSRSTVKKRCNNADNSFCSFVYCFRF